MAHLISIEDLNTTVNHEPRILDVTLADKLGMKNRHSIRSTIEANRQELEAYGEVSQHSRETTKRGGRPSTEYYLNEAQCLLVCMYSRTEKAAIVRKAIIEVFMAYRRGELVPATITPAQQSKLQQIVRERVEETGAPHVYFWSRFNNHYKLGSYKQLPYHCYDDAVIYLMKMEGKGNKLPALVQNMPAMAESELRVAYVRAMEVLDFIKDNTSQKDDWILRNMAERVAGQVKLVGDMVIPPERREVVAYKSYTLARH